MRVYITCHVRVEGQICPRSLLSVLFLFSGVLVVFFAACVRVRVCACTHYLLITERYWGIYKRIYMNI